jgi:hypothetical protein
MTEEGEVTHDVAEAVPFFGGAGSGDTDGRAGLALDAASGPRFPANIEFTRCWPYYLREREPETQSQKPEPLEPDLSRPGCIF